MKQEYVKPSVEVIGYDIDEPIMDDLILPSFEYGEDDDLE